MASTVTGNPPTFNPVDGIGPATPENQSVVCVVGMDHYAMKEGASREIGLTQNEAVGMLAMDGHQAGRPQNTQQISSIRKKKKVFICPICNKAFNYKYVLKNHERTHTDERPYECPECQRRFRRVHHLQQHIRRHTGEKPYRCHYCERGFTQAHSLKNHLMTHAAECTFVCQLCSYSFANTYQLKTHILGHYGKNPIPEQTEPEDLHVENGLIVY